MEPGYSGWLGSGYSSHPGHPYPYRCSPVFQQTAVCNDDSPAVTFTQQTNNYCDMTNVHLKVINPDKKSDFKVFTLKNPQSSWFASIAELRKQLVLQFGSKVVSQDPDSGLGYMRGQTKVWIHNESDLRYVWNMIEEGNNCTLWCDAYRESSKKSHIVPSDSDESDNEKSRHKRRKKVSALDEKRERIEGLKTKLRAKHSTAYTPIQYTLWAEMIDVGTHSSVDEPPTVPMFTGKAKSKVKCDSDMGAVFTEMAKSVISVLQPKSASTPPSSPRESTSTISPGKIAELRSKYLQQMKELHGLFETGALTKQEFLDQKVPILDHLKDLTPCARKD